MPLVPHTPGEMCISYGTVETLHSFFPHPRYEPFTREKPRRTQQGLHSRFRSLQTAPREPSSALVLSHNPLVWVPAPLNILLLLCASSFASENPEPSSLPLQLQAPCPPLSPACASKCSSSPGVSWRAKREGSY